jgi:hypothetical protein
VLWLAGLAAPLLYLAVGWALGRSVGAPDATGSQGSTPGNLPAVPIALLGLLGGLALLQTLGMLALRQRLAALVQFDPLRFFVVRFALAESVAVYGLVLFLLGRSWAVLLAFVAWALALMVLIRPSADEATLLREWGQGR